MQNANQMFSIIFQFFMLKVKNPEEPVAPGLSVSGVVVYESPVDCENSDRIVITVDGNVIEVPLFAYVL